MFTKSHPIAAQQYAEDVTEGRIVSGKYVKLACQRFLDDLKRDDIVFREAEAQKACNFMETLPHVKGHWAAQKKLLKLEPWQQFIECNIFGWYHENGRRRFQISYEEVARKNGKSMRLAARGLYMMCVDPDVVGDMAPEIFAGAMNEKQAFEVFRPALQMVKRTPRLKNHFDITPQIKSMFIASTGARFEPLIGKPGDGSSASMYICDEYWQHPDADQFEAMVTGQAARIAPLASVITTAGNNTSSACYEKRTESVRVLEGTVEDDGLFAILYCCDSDDQWDSEEALVKANPNLDVSVNRDFLLAQMQRARRSATLQNSFRMRHLCQWVSASTGWMNMVILAGQRKQYDIESLIGKRAWVGVDLASKKDLAAIAVLVPDGNDFYTFFDFFCPETAAEDNPRYRNMAEWITFTPGSATDYQYIQDRLEWLAGHFECVDLAFDPWQSQFLMQRLMERGLPVAEFPHQVRTMSDPMKEVEALILDRRMWINNPCAEWQFGETAVKVDQKDNVYPGKGRPSSPDCHVDAVVALIMAMGRYLMVRDSGSLDEWLADPVAMS